MCSQCVYLLATANFVSRCEMLETPHTVWVMYSMNCGP